MRMRSGASGPQRALVNTRSAVAIRPQDAAGLSVWNHGLAHQSRLALGSGTPNRGKVQPALHAGAGTLPGAWVTELIRSPPGLLYLGFTGFRSEFTEMTINMEFHWAPSRDEGSRQPARARQVLGTRITFVWFKHMILSDNSRVYRK